MHEAMNYIGWIYYDNVSHDFVEEIWRWDDEVEGGPERPMPYAIVRNNNLDNLHKTACNAVPDGWE